MLYYKQVLRNVFEKRESKCCGVLMKHWSIDESESECYDKNIGRESE